MLMDCMNRMQSGMIRIRGNDAQNDQDSARESVNAWISGLGYF